MRRGRNSNDERPLMCLERKVYESKPAPRSKLLHLRRPDDTHPNVTITRMGLAESS